MTFASFPLYLPLDDLPSCSLKPSPLEQLVFVRVIELPCLRLLQRRGNVQNRVQMRCNLCCTRTVGDLVLVEDPAVVSVGIVVVVVRIQLCRLGEGLKELWHFKWAGKKHSHNMLQPKPKL